MPTVSTPNLPVAAAIGNPFFATFLSSLFNMENHCHQPTGLLMANLVKIAVDIKCAASFLMSAIVFAGEVVPSRLNSGRLEWPEDVCKRVIEPIRIPLVVIGSE
jgi:hypothetical protein